MQMQKGKRKFLKSFFVRFSNIESTASVPILSNPPRYRYYQIGIDTFAITNAQPGHNKMDTIGKKCGVSLWNFLKNL